MYLWFLDPQEDDRYLKVLNEIVDHCGYTLVIAFLSLPERHVSDQ
ncbi:MAG: hypothetical protein QGG54_11855 [Gammaproteobacteria bacterium]|nr:hypothetical protein [Gammaproteobacteria bacterium]